MTVNSAYFVKSTPLRAFVGSFSKIYTKITDIVKMCMWEFDAEKILFDKIAAFYEFNSHFTTTAPSFTLLFLKRCFGFCFLSC